jgi:hypothetical protein
MPIKQILENLFHPLFSRLVLRLGYEFRYYPCPLFSLRERQPVFCEVGQTILDLLAVRFNYSTLKPWFILICVVLGFSQFYVHPSMHPRPGDPHGRQEDVTADSTQPLRSGGASAK